MIPTNLKVGDTFTENGVKFEVTAISPLYEGYESKRIGFTDGEVKTPEVTEEVNNKLDSFNEYTKTEINRLNVTELEAVCDKLGLEKSTGVAMKKAIIDHLGL